MDLNLRSVEPVYSFVLALGVQVSVPNVSYERGPECCHDRGQVIRHGIDVRYAVARMIPQVIPTQGTTQWDPSVQIRVRYMFLLLRYVSSPSIHQVVF